MLTNNKQGSKDLPLPSQLLGSPGRQFCNTIRPARQVHRGIQSNPSRCSNLTRQSTMHELV
eukprot:COSAG01_NODE_2397_length_7771_cov_12.578076_11_plen_61_part_00